ncbi:sugar ABC transporter substrate-binding protein [Candidatus Sumerlaeota bacterium]|nr:sugar ABC transporter substrate-binding protein [Candidatus Sumerlaeota bacterium]
MKNTTRRVARILIGLAVSFCLCICCIAADLLRRNPVSTRIDIWSWNVAAKCLDAATPAFEQKYPHIDAKVVQSGTRLQSRLMLSLISGVGAPDVTQLQCAEAPYYVASGRLMDLTSVAEPYEKQFSPAFWANCVHEGRVYAIPWDMGPCAIFYKRDIFKKYSADIDEIETWEDYIALGERIYELSGGRTKLFPVSVGGMGSYFEMLIQQARGGIFDKQGRIDIDSPATRKVLRVLRRMMQSSARADVGVFSHEFFASLPKENIATYPIAVWFGSSIKDYAKQTSGNWGVFRLPAIEPGGLRVSNWGGSVLAIPDQGKNKEESWKFIEFALCTRETQLVNYRDHDLFPALMTTFDDPFFDEPDPFFGGQKVRRFFASGIEDITVLNRTKDWNEAMRYVSQALSLWATSHWDDEKFIRDIERELHSKLKRDIAPESNQGEGL